MKIKISADSTCDLSPELIARYNIGITPLYIVRGDETLRDGIDVRPEELYAYAKATGKLCQTAAVNVSDYYAYFSAARAEYDAVIHFTISSDMSGCYQNACIAAREFTNVYPVDARNLSTGIGHLVLDAAEMAAQGMDAADIAAALEKKREKLDVSFVLDTLDYLGLQHENVIYYTQGAEVTLPKCAILMEKMGRYSHYLLCYDGTYYDPTMGILDSFDQKNLVGYLEIKTA